MIESDDEPKALPRLAPAPLGPRIAAGALDGVAVLVLGFGLFWIPFRMGAPALPVVAMVAGLFAWSVVPLAASGSTLGMRAFGVELVGRDGRPPDFLELLFRETLGRGLGPAAYVGAVSASAIAAMLGRVEMGGFGSMGWGLFIAMLLVTAALGGHLVGLGREDRRTLADLIGNTMVIPRAAVAAQTDEDEYDREQRASAKRRRMIFSLVAELVIFGGTLGLPLFLSMRVTTNREYAAHLELDADAKRFEHDPGNGALADELIEAYRGSGDDAKADAVSAKFEAAKKAKVQAQEASLRKLFADNPKDTDAADTLEELLEDQGRTADARVIREAVYRADPTPEALAQYGVWLYNQDLSEDAVNALRGSLDAGFDEAEVHAYLGMSLVELDKKPEGRHELHRALELDPDLDEVKDQLDGLEAEIGPEPTPKPAAKLVKKKGGH